MFHSTQIPTDIIGTCPEGKFLAIQNSKVLGCFDTRKEAEDRVNAEVERDRIQLFLKHRLLKKLLKKSNGSSFFTDFYLIAEVKAYEVPKLF